MNTEREILKAAAKAADVALLDWRETWADYNGPAWRTSERELWNPLTDDGDALRLAVKLGFTVATHGMGPYVKEASGKILAGAPECMEGELMACVRRQIVRAAAAMVDR